MFFMRFEGTPRKDAGIAPKAAGGNVACWVERPTLEDAIAVASADLQKQGWIVDDPEEAYEVDATDYPPGHLGREYFEQALIDKEVFVFFTYPEVASESAGD